MDQQILKLNLPRRIGGTFNWNEIPLDLLDKPEYYDGILWRRPVAFAIDIAIISFVFIMLILANTFTFGLLGGFIAILWPVIILVLYDTLLIGGSGAGTIGMRCLRLEVCSWEGARPSYLQAAINSALFSLITPWTGGIVLIIGLFSNRRRLGHDFLSGVVVIKKLETRH